MEYKDMAYFDKLKIICGTYLYHNYDYCYLSAMHKKNRIQGADTIILGNSHAMNGIIEKELLCAGDVISFCISSQDLYYNFLHLKKAVSEGARPIQRCLINLGYYVLYWDLSKSETLKGIITRTYLNLFGEEYFHHFEQAKRDDLFEDDLVDAGMYPREVVEPLARFWSDQVMHEQSSFYGDMMEREKNNLWGVDNVDWSSINDEQRKAYVNIRVVNGHNRHIKYKETREENGEILKEMVSFLVKHHIKPYFFITPYTKHYMDTIHPAYLPDIYEALDALDTPVEFFDMNYYSDLVTNDDFIDADHLNINGAHKATAVLNDYIKMAEGKS